MQYILPISPAYPELFLAAMACVILLVDLFLSDDKRIVTYALTQLTLGGCLAITLLTSGRGGELHLQRHVRDDLMADVLKLLVYISVMTMLVYSRS